ncbi:MAG: glucokinase [Verrucomicrobia bacterium]|nr:glucokinase [Verrucomicrobiota bacterium]MBS0645894.1 glucokinase [Verrucomicrobiota bacterium]
MLIAGDIGGTHTRLACVQMRDEEPVIVSQKIYASQRAASLQEILHQFLQQCEQKMFDAAVFAVPGPVIQGSCHTTNLPWKLCEQDIKDSFSFPYVYLLNDVEGHAWMLTLKNKSGLLPVYQGSSVSGNYALLALGTGLGEAGLIWNGASHLPFASEGGHCDFAPNNEEQWQLKNYLSKKWDHVSYERVLSGPGFVNLYMFYRDTYQLEEPAWLTQQLQQTDAPALLTQLALQAELPSCVRALDCFISILADEMGNCALKYLAQGGIFLAGGFVYKLLKRLQEPFFLQSYLDKGRLRPLLEKISITVIHDELSCVRGAARYADVHLRG